MAKGFIKLRFNVSEKNEEELRTVGTRGLGARGLGKPRGFDEKSVTFNTDESAARHYLGKILEQDERPSVRGMSRPERPEVAPDFLLDRTQEAPLTKTRLIQFNQTKDTIPIFGARVNIELDANRELVNVAGQLAEMEDVSPIPALSQKEALEKIAEFTDTDIEKLERARCVPELVYFHNDAKDTWHLAYLYRKVPAAPDDFLERALKREGHEAKFRKSLKERNPRVNYLVDAHDGEMLLHYSAVPLFSIPVRCRGTDENGKACRFWGSQIAGGFEMTDPLRHVKTFDLEKKDIENDPIPDNPVNNDQAFWDQNNPAAVSAHVNGSNVYDFFNSILMRDGVDDKGMELVSIVNCTYSHDQNPPEWSNACWWNNRMWYGQEFDENGKLRSFSRYLDIIAHELTHGVTENTSDLVYQGESGALNESVSDIFGIIIRNWYEAGSQSSIDDWNWELGAGLGQGGLPLRDFSDPKKTGDPDHMDDYLETVYDSGGVHTNSNIHNKAAYNVLSAVDENGEYIFTPHEVAVLYYSTLQRLGNMATFSDALEMLVEVANVFYAGDDEERQMKTAAIKEAYEEVGIT